MWTDSIRQNSYEKQASALLGMRDAFNGGDPIKSERWPFTVRIASTAEDVAQAVDMRHAAYTRHLPAALCEAIRRPEPLDMDKGTVVLLAQSKLDGSAMGTMRVQFNDCGPLMVESALTLPAWMSGKRLAEATRLGVVNTTSGYLVRAALVKAGYQICLSRRVDFMVIVARSPADRMYQRLLFKDVFPDGAFVPLEYVFNLPHRVLFSDIKLAKSQWEEAKHPMLDFMANTTHPDICIEL